MSEKGHWYNFVTGEYDIVETPQDFSDYIPQVGGRGLYKLYVEQMGMTPIEAAFKVLSFAVRENAEAVK